VFTISNVIRSDNENNNNCNLVYSIKCSLKQLLIVIREYTSFISIGLISAKMGINDLDMEPG